MRVEPNLFLVGTPKSYTTSLHDWLVTHPSVEDGPVKEFGSLLHSPWAVDPWSMRGWPSSSNPTGSDTTELECIHLIDSNPWVIYDEAAPARVRSLDPLGQAKVIISLRHPLDRALSMHTDQRINRIERRSASEALRRELERPQPKDSYPMATGAYLQQSRYDLYLHPWLEALSPDRLRIFFPDAAHGPQLRAMEAWLGLEPSGSYELAEANRSDTSIFKPLAPIILWVRLRVRSVPTAQRLWRRYEPLVAPVVHRISNFGVSNFGISNLSKSKPSDSKPSDSKPGWSSDGMTSSSSSSGRQSEAQQEAEGRVAAGRLDDPVAESVERWLAPARGIGEMVGRHTLGEFPDWLDG